jgi:hypothetical protein
MKAVVWHGVGDIRFEDVADPSINDDTADARRWSLKGNEPKGNIS